MSKELDLHKLTDLKWTYRIAIIIILISSMFSVGSLKRVDETEFGLNQNVWTGKVDLDTVYTAGRYPIGFWHRFILFPSIQVSMEFTAAGEGANAEEQSQENAILGRTQDGLAIKLDISFQYKLQKKNIPQLYKEFGTKYESVFFRIARDVIRDVSSAYTAIEFFNNRTLIGTEMEDQMRINLGQAFADIPFLQLRNVDLPDEFEAALERKEVARQEIEIARLEQKSALIRAETKILEAEAQRNVTIIEAEADAQAFIIKMEAQAQAINITLTAQKEAYYGLSQALNLTSAELLAFLWIQALQKIGEFGNLIVIGQNTPEILLNPTNSTATNITLF